jgi:hypothetical protein
VFSPGLNPNFNKILNFSFETYLAYKKEAKAFSCKYDDSTFFPIEKLPSKKRKKSIFTTTKNKEKQFFFFSLTCHFLLAFFLLTCSDSSLFI